MSAPISTDSIDQYQRIEKMRRGVLNVLLGLTTAFGTLGILFIFGETVRAGRGFSWYLAAYGGAWLLSLVLFIGRGIPHRVRALVFVFGIYGFAVFAFYSGWLAGGGRVFLLAAIVVAALLIEPRWGFWVGILSIFTYAAFGAAYYTGWLTLRVLPNPATLDPILVEGIGFLIVVGVVSMGLWFVGRTLQIAGSAIYELQTARTVLDQRALQIEQANQLLAERTAAAENARHEAETARTTIETEVWQSNALAQLGQAISGEQDETSLADKILFTLCHALAAPVGVFFVCTQESPQTLQLIGSYAYPIRNHTRNRIPIGSGLPGQAALEKKLLIFAPVPADYLPIVSSHLQEPVGAIFAAPFMFDGQVLGVIELGLRTVPTPAQRDLITRALETIGVAFHTARTRTQINQLLQKTQEQAASLRVREEALQATNEELRAQSENLQISQAQLREQQSALEMTNAELEEQRSVLDEQNRTLKQAQQELQARTEELTLANRYKSEFLANMSHELRTPLNSLLILAGLLQKNETGNLTAEQVESARIIHQSGSDLLTLINEILDLSKVEAGRMTFHFAPMRLTDLTEGLRALFARVAKEKSLDFQVSLAPDLPESIHTDQQRVQQILKNLLSNAFKFTERGSVQLHIERAGEQIALRVRDTGIGMNAEQQRRVFEAFQQADGSTSRKYGGTGLGLTISRELAARLGGKISVESTPDAGSVFTLYLPEEMHDAALPEATASPQGGVHPQAPAPSAEGTRIPTGARAFLETAALPDDRALLQSGDKILLIIEDDANFARLLYRHAQTHAFKCLLALSGEDGLALAQQYHPDAILLDLKLPGMDGWQVLDALKNDSALRHIPVHILSAQDETLDAYKRGALGFLSKPVSPEGLERVFEKIGDFLARDIKNLLVVEDDETLRFSVRQLLAGNDVKINEAATGADALRLLRLQPFDCLILDLTLPDMTGFDLLNAINADPQIAKCPVIVYTGKALTEQENAELLKYADSVIIKGVKSPERLLDETALFLHRVVADLPEEKRRAILRLRSGDAIFHERKVLVVDDDMRNAFALARLLSDKGMKATIARSGAKALEMLNDAPETELVLMDIMMPEMDGYEAIRRIRAQARFSRLPILALTAKAMKGDRERCLEAGANDYLSKPVDADRLFSLLRVWLYRE